MSDSVYVLIFLFYGLAFFSMGLAITQEIGRASDVRLRHALRSLAAFGLLHGVHEWVEMIEKLDALPGQETAPLFWSTLRILMLAISFLLLSAFGTSLLSTNDRMRRFSWLVPIGQAIIWGVGLLIMKDRYASDIWNVADVWSRYTLAIPAGMLACAGLIVLQRAFRRAGMERFGQDSLWAAIAFLWYGMVGQIFTRATDLPPSTFINQDWFFDTFGFPVQLLRAFAALAVAVFVIRFMRSFEVETQKQISELQTARLTEVQRREALRGEYLKRVVAAQEAERARIARELHDETGQSLTAIGLRLRGTSAVVNHDLDKAKEHLGELERLVARSLTELQRLIANLRPSHLDDLGLQAALRWYGEEVESSSTLEVEVEQEGIPREIPPEIRIALFRVAQEALGNVAKHADATKAKVTLRFENQSVGIRVEDDGKGFDLENISRDDRRPWGLLGMEERASLLRGKLLLDSKPGEGTRVLVTIPYDQEVDIDEENETSISR